MNNEKSYRIGLDFLVCCYFGQSKKLIKASIDRAYVDMASHTLPTFKNISEKWKCRYNASVTIYNRIKDYPCECINFDQWHTNTIKAIGDNYNNPTLNEGQLQKWLNMTIKYLFVFKLLYGIEDERLKEIRSFLNETSEVDYRVPIDSYVLKGIGEDDIYWSKLTSDDYKNINDKIISEIGKENGFMWELENWEDFSLEYGYLDKNSYARFCKDLDEKII